ncbi:MAG: glycosyl hydrolase, partial [Candidatus Thermochlorobacter sp.]
TRNDKTKLGPSGGPITKDNTSVEYYCTIFAAAESPIEKGVIWCGSDDGLIHITRDGGKTWTNVTPKDLPEWSMINSIEINPHEKGSAYIAATRYKLDDFAPYIYKTTDYGKTWKRIVKGIDKEHFTRVVRCDPVRKGLLFAGTESGVYISFDDGENWRPFQLNLPIVPITDMTIKDSDLIVATQGRSLWLIDDISPLRELTAEIAKKDLHLYTPRPSVRMEGSRPEKQPKGVGENLQAGVLFTFFLKEAPDSTKPAKLEIFDANGKLIRAFSTNAKENSEKLNAKAGSNRFTWNMRYPDAERFEGLVLWAGGTQGPKAVPGKYEARLSFGSKTEKVTFEIIKDPRVSASQKDLEEQFEFLISTRDKLSETHQAIKQIRNVREQLNQLVKRLPQDENKEIHTAAKELVSKLTKIEEALYQTKNRSSQDPLNFPIRLNNKLSALATLAGRGDNRPTDQMLLVRSELTRQIDQELSALKTLLEKDVPAFNELVRQKSIPSVLIKQKAPSAVGSN